MKQALSDRGADLSVNGSFDSATKSALASFRKSKSLVGDGVRGPLSWSAPL